MKLWLQSLIFGAICLLGFLQAAEAQNSRKYEFRGVWFTTVGNYDWPTVRGDTPANQQSEMIQMLDKLKSMNINVILFHTRPQGDAFYQSDIEPWSYYLTGEQGKAPNPLWDPLAFLIQEGHKRGMEVHAWINPFRSHTATSTVPRSAKHVSIAHKDWLLTVGATVIVDPGIPEARQYIIDVLADIAKRYDIDGIHYDDFFYPYDDINKNNEDLATYEKYGKTTFADIKDWRRDNINKFVQTLDVRLKSINPNLKHGVSPFGIWRSGTPAGIVGLSSRDVIFCDAVEWLRKDATTGKEPWIDYLTPQLYWKIGGSQDYKSLLTWWKTQMNSRHLYPGLAIYRAAPETVSGALFSPYEIPDQVRYNRDSQVQGEVYFRTQNLTRYSSQDYGNFLKDFFYKTLSLTPSMAWKDQRKPNPPQRFDYLWNGEEPVLTWTKSEASADKAPTRFYAIYRTISATEPDMQSVIADEKNLIAITSETSFKDKPLKQGVPFWYFVTAVSPNSIESTEKLTVKLEGRSVTGISEETIPKTVSLSQNYPNPFTQQTEIGFYLEKPQVVSLKIYNSLGQEIARLRDQEMLPAGAQQSVWDGRMQNGMSAPSGLYLYVLETNDGRRETKRMTKL